MTVILPALEKVIISVAAGENLNGVHFSGSVHEADPSAHV